MGVTATQDSTFDWRELGAQVTAYRQQAFACAALLQTGPGRPRDLRTVVPAAARILRHYVYGWFERTERGVYRLTADGEAALRRWPAAVVTARLNAEPISATPAATEPVVIAS